MNTVTEIFDELRIKLPDLSVDQLRHLAVRTEKILDDFREAKIDLTGEELTVTDRIDELFKHTLYWRLCKGKLKVDEPVGITDNPPPDKPTLGVIPKYIHDHRRYLTLCQAIANRYNATQQIPLGWVGEYNKYIEEHPDMIKLKKDGSAVCSYQSV